MPAPNIPTFAELLAAAQAEITARKSTLNDFRPGSNLDALSGSSAVIADTVIAHGIALVRGSCFIETAVEELLEALVVSRGGPERLPATFATTTLTLTRGAYVGAYTMTLGMAVTGVAPDGTTTTFTVSTATTLSAPSSSVSVPVVATVAGIAGNVPAGTLITSTIPSGLTLTQPSRAAGGNAAEDNESYRARYRLSLLARQQGTAAAIEFAARSVPSIRYAAVDETNITGANGYVAVFIADSTGEGSEALAALALAAIDFGDFGGLIGARSAGITVDVIAAVREEIALAYTVTVKAGSGIVAADVKTAVLAYLQTLEPSGTLYPSAPEEAIRQISTDVLDALQTTPSSARAPTALYNSIRTADNGSQITVTIVEV